MKKVIIVFFSLIVCCEGFAQSWNSSEREFAYWRQAELVADADSPFYYYNGVTTLAGVRYGGLRAGVGLGLHYGYSRFQGYGDIIVPLFLSLQADIINAGKFAPFIDIRGGADLDIEWQNIIPFAQYGVGFRYSRVSISIGTKHQRLAKNAIMKYEYLITLGLSF